LGPGRRQFRPRALVPLILAADPSAREACGAGATTGGAQVTSTGIAVVMIAPRGGDTRAVVKIAATPAAAVALEREEKILGALHEETRLADWRRLVPTPRASGILGGFRYRVDTALGGRVTLGGLAEPSSRRRLLEAAAEAIHALHQVTATEVELDDRRGAGWIDGPVDDVLRHGGAPGRERGLREVAEELRAALAGRRLHVGWVHGDYWPGNLLFDGDAPLLRGIVDWDAAAPAELPALDLLHLVLYTRRLTSGRELGEIVRHHLRGGGWPVDEVRLLDRYGAWSHESALSPRQLLLLYWLRHVAHHARQQSRSGALAYRRWRRANVRPILGVP
jgi:aminoglycoside phosphotransferase (APT) family kinase protein